MEITRHWRLKDVRYRLQGVVINGYPVFPPRPVPIEYGAATLKHPDSNEVRVSEPWTVEKSKSIIK
jgi:hypothetical protein